MRFRRRLRLPRELRQAQFAMAQLDRRPPLKPDLKAVHREIRKLVHSMGPDQTEDEIIAVVGAYVDDVVAGWRASVRHRRQLALTELGRFRVSVKQAVAHYGALDADLQQNLADVNA